MADQRQLLMLNLFIRQMSVIIDLVINDEETEVENESSPYQPIGKMPPVDMEATLKGSIFMRQHVNCNETMLDYIVSNLSPQIANPRNINFKYTWDENAARRQSPSKISLINRIIHFMHTMSEKTKVWDNARQNGWNPSSSSRDFKHVLMYFVRTFADWIRPMSNAEKLSEQGSFESAPQAYSIIDGSMFRRQKSAKLRPDITRADYYDHKHKTAESINVQAVCTQNQICTHLLTGVPGRMCDSNASRYVAANELPGSMLCDDGYPADPRFCRPDGTDQHKQDRVPVEWMFGHTKNDWCLVGSTWNRSSEWHNLGIRGAFILNNMKRVFGV
eukprot:107295_1